MKRKRMRAPGGGRKPSNISGKMRSKTVRLPIELIELLKAKAQQKNRERRQRNESKWDFSEEVRWRLDMSLRRELENQHDPATRALAFLIAEATRRVHFGEVPEWHFNPFLFKALKLAVAGVLNGIAPQGEITPPSISKLAGRFYPAVPDPVMDFLAQRWETPEKTGTGAAGSVLRELYRPDPLKKAPEFEHEIYGFEQARRDLGIDKRIEGRKDTTP